MAKVKQLTVSLENRPGTLAHMAKVLADQHRQRLREHAQGGEEGGRGARDVQGGRGEKNSG